ncbi:hypothetical protein EB093_05525 [bacterium]|nr:hypothetical protein [bacterium]
MTIEKKLEQLAEQAELSPAEIRGVRDCLTLHIERLDSLVFPAGFGFESFTLDEVVDYFLSENHFNLSFKRQPGKGILYGLDHVAIRRNLFNSLPISLRRVVLLPKIKHFGIDQHMSGFLGMRSCVSINDAEDIGMGHSVFRVSTPHGQLVIKQESVPNQQFYVELLRVLGYPWFKSRHFSGERSWEITDYLGDENLNDRLVNQKICDWNYLIDQLAQHAAIGDVLGREDRHFENYVTVNDTILPVDTATLFGFGNEHWSERYIAGGLYEICILRQWIDNPDLMQHQLSRFKTGYMHQLSVLRDRQLEVRNLIAEFFQQPTVRSNEWRYVESRLNDRNYELVQFRRYRDGLVQMARRLDIRRWLESIPDKVLNMEPILKMYVLADRRRWSTLFLFDRHESSVRSALRRHNLVVEERGVGQRFADTVNGLNWDLAN